MKQTRAVTSLGVVREWSAEQGVGIVDSPDTAGGCWVHYSAVAVQGYKDLTPGQSVEFDWEAPGQDGFDFRAIRVWPAGPTPYDEPVESPGRPSPAYHSELTLTFDDEGPARF